MIGHIEGNVLDLYCGAGSIGLSLLKMGIGKELVGVEIVKEAIIDARHNAKINGLEAKSFFRGSPRRKKCSSISQSLKRKFRMLAWW